MAQTKEQKAAAAAKKKEAAAKKKAAATKTPRAKAEVKNGVRKPMKPESKCGQVWAAADKLTKGKVIPTIQDLLVVTDKAGLNQSNVRVEYQAWRTFNGYAPVRRGTKKDAKAA